jgi:thiamine biosynthesis lipoprotein
VSPESTPTVHVAWPVPRDPEFPSENRRSFDCFGSQCTVLVADERRPADAVAAAAMAERALLGWHHRFSRFQPGSELSRLNRDPRLTVPVSPLMRRLVEAALDGARETNGLMDATLGAEIEHAGYRTHFAGAGLPLAAALAAAPPRAPAGPRVREGWRAVSVDRRAGTVTRPAGVKLDPGGIAKGVFADELASMLSGFDAFAVDCAGDVRLGGAAGTMRPVRVESPFDQRILHTWELSGGGVATSGIGRRSWLGSDGLPAHHLLDPSTGRPAFTGVVQATALAPTAAEAEALAKAALLSGPDRAADWLCRGGLIVFDDGSYEVLEPAAPPTAAALTRSFSHEQRSSSTAPRSGSFKISW